MSNKIFIIIKNNLKNIILTFIFIFCFLNSQILNPLLYGAEIVELFQKKNKKGVILEKYYGYGKLIKIKHGLFFQYYENGLYQKIQEYNHGKKTGLEFIFEINNGSIKTINQYNCEIKHGKQYYFKNNIFQYSDSFYKNVFQNLGYNLTKYDSTIILKFVN